MAWEHPFGKLFYEQGYTVNPADGADYICINGHRFEDKTWMALLLLEEMDLQDGSAYKAFLDILPKAFKDFPVFFDEEELAYLEGCTLLHTFMDLVTKQGEEEYAQLCKACDQFSSKWSLREFMEAV